MMDRKFPEVNLVIAADSKGNMPVGGALFGLANGLQDEWIENLSSGYDIGTSPVLIDA